MEWHRSDQTLVDGEKTVSFTAAQACVFDNMWVKRGEWITVMEVLTNPAGDVVPSEDPKNLIHHYMATIRRKLKAADIDLVIENMHQSFWQDTKYRIK